MLSPAPVSTWTDKCTDTTDLSISKFIMHHQVKSAAEALFTLRPI